MTTKKHIHIYTLYGHFRLMKINAQPETETTDTTGIMLTHHCGPTGPLLVECARVSCTALRMNCSPVWRPASLPWRSFIIKWGKHYHIFSYGNDCDCHPHNGIGHGHARDRSSNSTTQQQQSISIPHEKSASIPICEHGATTQCVSHSIFCF